VTKPVLLVRASGNAADAAALAKLGLDSVSEAYLDIHEVEGEAGSAAAARLLAAVAELGAGDWVVATSLNALVFWHKILIQTFDLNLGETLAPKNESNFESIESAPTAPSEAVAGASTLPAALVAARARGVRFAAIGEATAKKYSEFGIDDALTPAVSTAAGLAEMLLSLEPVRARNAAEGSHATAPTALIPLGNLAMPTLTTALDAAGWRRISEVVYETAAVADEPESAAGLRAGEFSALLLRSPSAARAVAHHAGLELGGPSIDVPVICGGETTAETARQLGFNVLSVAPATSAQATAQAIFETVTSAPNRKTV
jgi:uroporphyrinogen-III synthase